MAERPPARIERAVEIERLPRAYRVFVERFNSGEYFDAHETLEAPWRKNKSAFYKGLIIYTSAFVHRERRNPAGVAKQLGKVPGYLRPYAPGYMGLDVTTLIAAAATLRARAEAQLRGQGTGDAPATTPGIPEPPVLTLTRQRIRGDEAELRLADDRR